MLPLNFKRFETTVFPASKGLSRRPSRTDKQLDDMMTSYTKSHALIGSCVSSLSPYLTHRSRFFSPVQYLAHRLYNAAASSASRLRSADSLAITSLFSRLDFLICLIFDFPKLIPNERTLSFNSFIFKPVSEIHLLFQTSGYPWGFGGTCVFSFHYDRLNQLETPQNKEYCLDE